ncbi:glycyl-radical enzyme activating protein family [Alkaliphilus metalliredigens QYMF]|uniref:Choline trimethylamine-lyase activating enzyme n=1 Tax=Alkaliphilus metalliredigens (strain QYMF) TaxID=293826 RepID=A6TUT4_ALKMQ|nr:choline TMA-lyase-activating enzyme [Alkaliphilus metalliredigens]ABR49952.1 glycyl-radical enzyme activating protein family [Alkaliphilus metalliredigens QYMF]
MSYCTKNTIKDTGRIFNIQKYNTYDGPGVRTLVFFKGCPLRCKWCSNPEGLEKDFEVLFDEKICSRCQTCVAVCPVGIHSAQGGKHLIDRSKTCIGCRKCEEECQKNAISIMGEDKTVEELLEIIEEDSPFYDLSGGGVTLGGGEVLMQSDFAGQLLKACKKEWIHTAIETSGYVNSENLLKLAENVDLFLYDLKHINSEKHYQWTGVYNDRIFDNLKELLNRKYNVKIRMPLLKGVNDRKEDIDKLMRFIEPYKNYENFKGIDLLPYHKLGVNKYRLLDKTYPIEGDPSLNKEDLKKIESWIEKYDLPVTVILH